MTTKLLNAKERIKLQAAIKAGFWYTFERRSPLGEQYMVGHGRTWIKSRRYPSSVSAKREMIALHECIGVIENSNSTTLI